MAVTAYLLAPSYFYLSADALIKGDLVPVSPLYRARIDKLFVKCGDQIQAGQKLALISNFLVQADYAHQYEQAATQLQLSKIGLDEGVAAALSEEETAHQKYLAASIDADRLGDVFTSYDRAFQSGAIGQIEWQAKRDAWKSAQAIAEGAHSAWTYAQQHVQRVQIDEQEKIRANQETSERSRSLVERTGGETITAPVSGYIVDCVDREQITVDAGSKLFNIFDPQHAYALAYFDPNSLEKVHIGSQADVTIQGITHPYSGRIKFLYPNLASLPHQLTRFFWQHAQWSEYRPVRISFDHLPHELRKQLYYGAQARVRIRLHDSPFPNFPPS